MTFFHVSQEKGQEKVYMAQVPAMGFDHSSYEEEIWVYVNVKRQQSFNSDYD